MQRELSKENINIIQTLNILPMVLEGSVCMVHKEGENINKIGEVFSYESNWKERLKQIDFDFREHNGNLYLVKTIDPEDDTLNIGKEIFPEDDHFTVIGRL